MFDPGDCANQYVIGPSLGQGGQGVVFKATDTSLNRPVVLKFLLGEWTTSVTAVERFRREAQSASQLNHPNVCTIYEINTTENDVLFISMAYYEGETLGARIRRGSLPWQEVVELGIGIAGRLQAAHTAKLVCSFKPNGYALCDMAGNLWEWVADWYGKTYYAESPAEDPQGPASGLKRVLRGGSYGHAATTARVADRFYYSVDSRHATFGIRCVMDF